jgi:hypothetical protein
MHPAGVPHFFSGSFIWFPALLFFFACECPADFILLHIGQKTRLLPFVIYSFGCRAINQ